MLEQITPLIITFNEAPNIERVLDRLGWAARIIVVDSGSADGTLAILARYPKAETLHRPFDSFAEQCNFGLGHVRTDWVLSLDADYVLSERFVEELKHLNPDSRVSGYSVPFVYCIHGHPLRGSLYPPRTVLYRASRARYVNEGHGHRVAVSGEIVGLKGPIFHDDRKPLSRWLDGQKGYAEIEARYLLEGDRNSFGLADRIRRLAWPAPFLVFFYTLIVKGCLFDGRVGWYYTLQRTLAEIAIALAVIDRRLEARTTSSSHSRTRD